MTRYRLGFAALLVLFSMGLALPGSARAENTTGVFRATFAAGGRYLAVEVLDDDLAHFQLSVADPGDGPIWTTPMVARTDYPGPTVMDTSIPGVIETPQMRLEIDAATLCVTITDLSRDPDLFLTTLCPLPDEEGPDGLSFARAGVSDLYGLGEQFQRRGGTDGNWIGRRRLVLNPYGNELTSFNGGNVGNAQFPILYALGAGTENYALFLDDVYQQFWDFSGDPFVVATMNDVVRWYVMTGPDLPDLRRDYLELTGFPPVPPRQMFGLWVSEYGYDDWQELTGVLESLRAADFPVDGFVLDLQWFGGIGPGGGMGSLSWDTENFPDPPGFIRRLREEHGAGIMVIEESYVADSLPDYDTPELQGVLARECGQPGCPAVTMNDWWGYGGMVDWTDPDAAAWWHDHRRQPLIDDGVMAHWTDLGEPETYTAGTWYAGFPELSLHTQEDVHNVYNLLWSRSIWEGYHRNEVERRPFILSRSGTAGSQRYGVAMWSGDIGSNLVSLAAHMQVQMQMSLSGIDYFGSDVGGFFRRVIDPGGNVDEMYTIWLANAALLDVPLRPHTNNERNEYPTAPSLVGDVASNLANVRLRYELGPYLYTLAHRAYRSGEAIFAPLVYYFQDDPAVRALGSQKMIGPDLMMVTVTAYGMDSVPVYLPAGRWINYHTGEAYEAATGTWIDAPTTVGGVFQVPLFVRDGAIFPQMAVDGETLNMLGQRRDGAVRDELLLRVYGLGRGGRFTLIEDDGETLAYQDGAVSETPVAHGPDEAGWFVEVGPSEGSYDGAPERRGVEIRLATSGVPIAQVYLDGAPLPRMESPDAFESAETGWIEVEPGIVLAKCGAESREQALRFVFAVRAEPQ